ncbi:MAG: hypothetical protein ACI85H_001141 [Paracoccaceae bacterium]
MQLKETDFYEPKIREMTARGAITSIPPRTGRAVRLSTGEAIQIVNTHGTQVVDTWCFNINDMKEFMSMEHNRVVTQSLFPKEGDMLYSNRRRPILHLETDTSPGRHDTLLAACDVYRYMMLGCKSYHDNCTDNLHGALSQNSLRSDVCPSPLNLWMNIPISVSGHTEWGMPLCKPGDFVVLRAQLDCVVVMSTCPQDIVPINGADCVVKEVHYSVLETSE